MFPCDCCAVARGRPFPSQLGMSCCCLNCWYGNKAPCSDSGACTQTGCRGKGDTEINWVPAPGAPSSLHVLLVPVCAWEQGRFSLRFRSPSTLTDMFAVVLTFKGLDQLRSRAEHGRRMPVPLRKHKTIKEEQWSLLPFTQNTKRHQTVAELEQCCWGSSRVPWPEGSSWGGELQTSPLPQL